MRKHLFVPIFLMVFFASCKKQRTSTTSNQSPAFSVEGITGLTMYNDGSKSNFFMLGISVYCSSSTHQIVTLALSGLPAGITMNTNWVNSGDSSFNTELALYDTTLAGVTPGDYTLTLSATGSLTGTKTYLFILTIKNPSPIAAWVTGKYINCNSCITSSAYSDSIYADTTIQNKIWFTNFYNAGALVYGLIYSNSGLITIPIQTVGSNTYYGRGSFSLTVPHSVYLSSLTINSGACNIIEN